jgi:hypothetical protein
MFRALLAHPQEALTQTALGILRAYNVSCLWQRNDYYEIQNLFLRFFYFTSKSVNQYWFSY